MSKMSELHAEITEMVEAGFERSSIIEYMVVEGLPREACPSIIDVIAGDVEAETIGDE